MNAHQGNAVANMLRGSHHRGISFGYSPFDLPAGYVTFTLVYSDGSMIHGGISPEGDVST